MRVMPLILEVAHEQLSYLVLYGLQPVSSFLLLPLSAPA